MIQVKFRSNSSIINAMLCIQDGDYNTKMQCTSKGDDKKADYIFTLISNKIPKILMRAVISGCVAKWLPHLPCKQKIASSILATAFFTFCILLVLFLLPLLSRCF